ncbi:MAG: hypothetical protein IPO81_16010 [Kouleothrix sp.]|nr:hypothetical protein [Kouleothrix sp.]
MRTPSYLRNIVVAALAIALVLISALQGRTADATPLKAPPAVPLQQGVDFSWSPTSATATIVSNPTAPVTIVISSFLLRNNGTATNTFDVTIPDLPAGWTYTVAPTPPFPIAAGTSTSVTLRIVAPANVAAQTVNATLTATKVGVNPIQQTVAFLTITVNAPPTVTPIPTATTGPTVTPGPVCPESPDPGGKLSDARLIRVDVPEQHGICTIGDEDWFKFGGLAGKVYTIDISQMDAGLDLSLELYNADGNLLTNNDDFSFRNPNQPDPRDIKPRIQSWRAPYSGFFYVRVRDILNIGGDDNTYTIVVNSESYGPTPAQITEVCRDLFEEDGLPEQARLITSNESQYRHVLCPTGDADWIKFFGLRGKTYYIYTDTRPYRNNPDINNQTEAGADTVIYLADRDGVSIIDFNDDIPGSLDSELRFTPSADGFYYAQIKNVGDIGNQFIKYDLTLKLCVPGQECGRSPVAPPPPASAQGTPTRTPVEFINTPTPTPTTVGGFLQNSLKPGPMVNGPLRGFADPAFNQVWQRSDRPIAERRANRSWTWGPGGLMARTEGYIQTASGLRQVQYFDKARMEVNNPRGDRGSKWFVTTGLLVIEMITGRTQIGDGEFVQHAPADIPIAGDPGDPNAPTYASFGGATGLQPGDRTGQTAGETIDRVGTIGGYAGPARPEARLVHFVPESGHNIPQVFWSYLNASGTVYDNQRYRNDTIVDWVFTLGYPISEPYWTRIKVGGVDRDVLVQAYQRRVLTYSPDNPSGWQVEMGNVGRHYYFWRYGEELP